MIFSAAFSAQGDEKWQYLVTYFFTIEMGQTLTRIFGTEAPRK